jgi:cysteine-rich repeat protein
MKGESITYNIFSTDDPYNNSVDKLSSLVLLASAIGRLLINYTINVGLALYELLIQVLFGWVRGVLIAGFLFSLLSVAIMDNHRQVFESSNSIKCANVGFFNTLESSTGILADNTPPIICFWNFIVSFNSVFLRVAVNFFWRCSDLTNVFKDFITLLAKIAESVVLFFLKPGPTSVLKNRFDFESIVTALQDLISNLKNPLICACSDFAVFSDYILSLATDKNIPSAIGNYGTALNSFWQVPIQTFLNFFSEDKSIVPVVEGINNVCYGSISAGLFIDNAVTNFVQIFWTAFPPSRVGSVIAYLICILTDLGFLFTDSTLHYIWTAAFNSTAYNVFKDANLIPIIEHFDQLGICLTYTLTPLNICLAQTVGNAFRLISAFMAYSKGIVQDGQNNLYLVKNALDRFVGQSSYGGGGHILNPDGHDDEMQQTSLTCLIATSLNFSVVGYTTCSTKIADLVNSLIQLLLTPLVLLTEVLDNRSLLENIDGNPLQSSTRDDFETFFEQVFDAVLDQVFSPFDYLAHLVGCIPVLSGFSGALVQAIYNLRNIARDLRTLLIKVIELVIEFVILVITLLSGPVFPNSTEAGEFSIFGQLLIDLFKALFTFVVEFVKNLFNLSIGALFPILFNQPTIYADSHTDRSSPATLPQCFESFGDCVCGIFYVNVGKKVCIPFTDVCIADILPSCGLFQTTPTWTSTQRRRFEGQLPYDTWFEYLADEFPNGTCGEVFKTFRNYGKDERGYLKRSVSSTTNSTAMFYEKPVPSLQGTAFVTCLTRLMSSFELSEKSNWTLPYDYYIQDSRFVDSTSEIVRGSGMLFFDTLVESFTMLNYPEYLAGMPTPDLLGTEETKEFDYDASEKWLSDKGVNDPLALDFLARSSALVSSGFRRSKELFYSKSRMIKAENRDPYVRIAQVGGSLLSTMFGTGLLVLRETFTSETVPMLASGSIEFMGALQTTKLTDIFPPVQQTAHLRKRDHSEKLGGIYFPTDIPTLEMNELDDLVIPDSARVMFKAGNLFKGSMALGRKIAGPYLELLARRDMQEEQFGDSVPLRINRPRFDTDKFKYNEPEDVISENGYYHYSKVVSRNIMPHVYALNISLPNSLMGNEVQNFHPDISYLYGMGGMIDFQHHIPYSCTRIHGYCDTNTLVGCDEDMYFQTLGLCNGFVGDFGIVSQCGEDFQAFAIYATDSCNGNPLRVAIATPSNPISCVRFSINPIGQQNDYFCVRYDECQACPVKKVIPNLNCDYLDEIFHKEDYILERCWALLVGPIYPPFNFSNILPTVTEPLIVDPVGNYIPVPTPTPAPTSTCTSVCGDRIKSTELDANGFACEECDDGNTRDGDGCSSRCKREKCPRYRTPSFPVAIGQEVPPTCSSGTIQTYLSRRTSRYCYARNIVLIPYSGKTKGTDVPLDSLQISCTGNRPVVTEYDLPGCNGYSVTQTINNNCSNESPLTMQYYQKNVGSLSVLGTAMGVRLGTDITCKYKCNVCGDGIVSETDQCDTNPFSSTTCVYCIKTIVTCNIATDICNGVCRPNKGEIPVDSRYGVQATSFCAQFLGAASVQCPPDYTCYWFFAVQIANTKRNVLPNYDNQTDVLEVLAFNRELVVQEQELAKREMEELHQNYMRDIANTASFSSSVDPMVIQPLPVHQGIFTLQSSPVKDNFMYTFSKKVANDVIQTFTSSSADNRVQKIIDWVKRPGVGPQTPPNQQGLAYEAAFPFICDTVKSFDGTLGYGLIKGTVIWLAVALVLVVIGALAGAMASSIGLTVLMLIGLTLWLRLTFGIAAVGCYITASQYFFRIPEGFFVEIHDVAVLLNGTCIDFLQPLASSPCDRLTCNQTFMDCSDLNYVDGFDTFFAIIEVWLPSEISVWIRTSSKAAELENALKQLSSWSGYDLYGSYSIAKTNFDFQGVIPHEGHKICSIITGFSLYQISLLLLVSIYAVYNILKVTIPAYIDLSYAIYAFLIFFNRIILIPIQAKMHQLKLLDRIEGSRKKSDKVEFKLM